MPEPRKLQPLGRWERLVRGRFEIRHNGSLYVVDSLYIDLDERIRLYRDGELAEVRRGRARFRLGDGARIEAAAAKLGMKYVHMRVDGIPDPIPLQPSNGTPEAWRARLDREHPDLSRIIGFVSLVVLLVVLVIELPGLVNLVGSLTPLVGWPEFKVPTFGLPVWANAGLILTGGLAGLERSLSMEYNALLDD
jgi:hypothetical protein